MGRLNFPATCHKTGVSPVCGERRIATERELSVSLADHLKSRFRGDTRFRGAKYLKQEQIVVTAVNPMELTAVIADDGEFQAELLHNDDGLQLRCSCSRKPDGSATCRHLWAAILVVDRDGFLAGTPAADYVPPFAGDSSGGRGDWGDPLLADMADDDVDFADFLSRGGGRRSWEVRLTELSDRLSRQAPAEGGQREISYQIDLAHSRSQGQLVVQTSQRQRRANGQWGKWKPLRIRGGNVAAIEDPDDRHLLTLLIGGIASEPPSAGRANAGGPSTFRYRVPTALVSLILPQLCDRQRLVLMDENEAGGVPLTWDDGPAWNFRLAVEQDTEASVWRLLGRFHRAEEELGLDAVRLVLPGIFLSESSIHCHQEATATTWAGLLEADLPFAVPVGDENELVARLLDLPDLPDLELPEPLQLKEIEVTPIPELLLTVPRARRWHRERLSASVQFDYAGNPVPAHSSKSALILKQQRCCTRRNPTREAAAWTELESAGFQRIEEHQKGLRQVEITLSELPTAIRSLIESGWQVHADDMPVRQPGELQMSVRSNIDWFELHGEVEFSGQRVRFPELLAALSRGEGAIRLEDGSLGLLPEEWSEQYNMITQLGVIQDEHVRFAASQVILLDALLASRPAVDIDETFAELRRRLETFSGIEAHEEPESFVGSLRNYQKEGLGWLKFLEEFRFGGCLADDMGLGKTVQVLAMLTDREPDDPSPRPSLVVVPRSLMFNWRDECQRFCPALSILEYAGIDRAELRGSFGEHDLILTTYGMLRRDILELKDIRFNYVVLDEAQTIKNAGSQVAKAARLLQAEHRLALSGTPIENHLGDLWSIFEFLNPGMLGRSSLFRNFTNNGTAGRELLTRGLAPFILRRTKKQVATELPERFEQTIQCRMGPEQQRLYDEMRDHYRQSLLGMVQEQGLSRTRMHVLEALLRLRQAACHPGLLDAEQRGADSAKLDTLCPLLEELIDEGHKALVFSQFTSMLAIVRQTLDQKGIRYEYLDGQTRDRRARIEHFQSDPDCGVFLISLKAGGLGLNLNAADYVFLLDPWWNPAVEMQAIDRAHRIGQTRPVFAYRLICEGTVEEKITDLQQQKRELADAILLENRSVLKNLTRDDLELLLS